MRIITLVFAVMLASALFPAGVRSDATEKGSGTVLENGQEKTKVLERVACECCKECMAAKKSTGHEEEGPPAANGCQGCCKKCGKVITPLPEKIPPEIIEKK